MNTQLMQLHGFRAAVFETRNLRAAPLSNFATTASCLRMAQELNSTGDQFVEENQRHRVKKARALTVMMAERTPLADAVAAAEAVAVLADGMDNSEFSDEQSWQSPPPSLPPGPPEDQDPIVTPPPSPPSFGLAGDGGRPGGAAGRGGDGHVPFIHPKA
jgi:hypothetical protein